MTEHIGMGDLGDTSLFSGRRISKESQCIEAVGNTDELNGVLGMILTMDLQPESREILETISHMTFDIGAEICAEGKFMAENVSSSEVIKMTEWILFLDEKLPELREFMLPSGAQAAIWLNYARAVTRRLERSLVPLLRTQYIRAELFAFVNRLSRLLFSLERWENFRKSGEETKWKKGRKLPEIPFKNSVITKNIDVGTDETLNSKVHKKYESDRTTEKGNLVADQFDADIPVQEEEVPDVQSSIFS
ncbi:cob(I)yrinic acid a,c-diamide adenosyltransferase [Candidatus Peregrinibacteria bacterium]|nr:cob(I)yrinic acid a,c-diamide adenosyltransferase [Candidatus Peregrinibacteria bacterium]